MTSVPIDGHTQLVGLIGWPVEHSLSPAMHNAAFDALRLNWRYVPLPVRPDRIESAIRGLAALGFRGANVTVPHKRALLPFLDTLAPDASALGAVNTIVVGREEDKLIGHNTDAQGFIGALRHAEFEPQGKRVAVVGAGGAARAVVYGLLTAGAAHIALLNRTPERAEALLADMGSASLQPSRLCALPLTAEHLAECAREADLLVNSTSVGMWPEIDGSIWPLGTALPAHLTVFDLVYNPLQTRLLQQAQESGAQAIDGLGMLVEQGALAFELWTGRPAPLEVMRAASGQTLAR